MCSNCSTGPSLISSVAWLNADHAWTNADHDVCVRRVWSNSEEQFVQIYIEEPCLWSLMIEKQARCEVNPQSGKYKILWWRHQMRHFSRYWPFVWGIHRSPVNSRHKGQWRGALAFSLICAWINAWMNNFKAGDLRRYRDHYDVIVMWETLRPIRGHQIEGI